MKLKKRKIRYSAIFFLCWFALLVFLVDGVLKFQTLVDYFGSYALVEIALLLLVFLPTLAVYLFTKVLVLAWKSAPKYTNRILSTHTTLPGHPV